MVSNQQTLHQVPKPKAGEVDGGHDFQKEYSTLQQTPQVNPQYNSRRNEAVNSSHKNFKVTVVRSQDGQRKQISGAKFGTTANTHQSSTHAYDGANNEYSHP